MEYLVFSARRFDFKDEEGRSIQGIKLWYADPEDEGANEQKGFTMLETTADVAVWETLRDEPGFYHLDFGQRPGARGRATLFLRGASYVRPLVGARPAV